MKFSIKAVQPNSLCTGRYVADTVNIKQIFDAKRSINHLTCKDKMKKNIFTGLAAGLFLVGMTGMASATIISITDVNTDAAGVNGSEMGLPVMDIDPVTEQYILQRDNNNDGVLHLWNERQNVPLEEILYVDRVADPTATYVGGTAGNYFIEAGTIVSSHYVQWDPVYATVQATLNFDADVFAVIHSDRKLADSDYLGHPGINYGDFNNRGIEPGDDTVFNGSSVYIDWTASSPGDWARVLTAYSPTAAVPPPESRRESVPEPSTMLLLGTGLAGLVVIRRKKGGSASR